MITKQLCSLPSWLRLYLTSREEPQIQQVLAKFKPRELRADEAKNRADVEIKLRKVARKHVKGNVSMEVLAADIKNEFNVEVGDKMGKLQEKMDESVETYMTARTASEAMDCFNELFDFETKKPDVKQKRKDFKTVYAQAKEAQKILRDAIASEWVLDDGEGCPKLNGKPFVYHPKPGTIKKAWIEMVDDPGVKGEARAKQKVENDYGGDASKLKDLARLTLRFTSPKKLAQALRGLEKELGFKIEVLKNKWASPTPLGYSDFNLVIAVPLADGTEYLCEIQLNLQLMIDAKVRCPHPHPHPHPQPHPQPHPHPHPHPHPRKRL